MGNRYLDNFNWTLMSVVLAILVIGLLNLFSAVYYWEEGGSLALFWSQMIWVATGLVVMVMIVLIDYRIFKQLSPYLYAIVLLLLLAAALFGTVIHGTRGWLTLGPINLQPSEFAKLAYVLVAARYFSDHPNPDGYRLRDLWQPGLLMLASFFLIVSQGDMGSSLFLICIFASMALFARIRRRTLITCAIIGIIGIYAIYSFGLKPYQRERIFTFLNPEADVRGSGYHLMQSKIAVGSGMIFGKGYLKGDINKLRYLPERHTDFIFPVLAEEWGFVGGVVILGLYGALLLIGVEVAKKARDRFGIFLAIGIVSMIFWQVTINLGGVLGLIPLTGVTLPFLSYGGSSIISLLMAIGILFNISLRRFMF